MAQRIEDYAMVGNTLTAALVGRDGSVDWLCMPRFDSPACFSALLGGPEHGRWLIAPAGEVRATRRRYRDSTLILETEFETDDGAVRIIDFMPVPPREEECTLIRLVQGLRGSVAMRTELVVRMDYGKIVPWVRRLDGDVRAVAGPDAVTVRTPVYLKGQDFTSVADFTVSAGQTVPFTLAWSASHRPAPAIDDPEERLAATDAWWREWSGRCTFGGRWHDTVLRSLITLKALTYSPTGGTVAAATTSLPEKLGGVRNWDYRFCWIRDATLTLYALLLGGYKEEARAWRQWLLRAVAGHPSQLQIMYGVAGERRLEEYEVPWLGGYEGSQPVRVGNAAHQQFQLDVYGEIMDVFHVARKFGLQHEDDAWRVQEVILDFLEDHWRDPDEGIWEIRGPRRPFTHSKVMCWVAADRAVKAVERFGLPGSADRWRTLRDAIHRDVCDNGFSGKRNAFVQYEGGTALDASLLIIPLVGFLPPNDPRVVGTVEAIQRELVQDGFVLRYQGEAGVDGLPAGEGAFLACSFWLADNLSMMGRRDEAEEIFRRLLALSNDVGLLAEEYDPVAKRQLGNFPQAFSHVALVNTANNLKDSGGPAAPEPAKD